MFAFCLPFVATGMDQGASGDGPLGELSANQEIELRFS